MIGGDKSRRREYKFYANYNNYQSSATFDANKIHRRPTDMIEEKALLQSNFSFQPSVCDEITKREKKTFVDVSNDIRQKIRAPFNQNFHHIFRRFYSSNNVKLEIDHALEDRVKFRKKKRLFYNICRPHRTVDMLLMDWIFLTGLGVVMAVLSLILDYGVDKLQTYHMIIMENFNNTEHTTTNTFMAYAAWSIYATILLMLAATIVHYLSINAMGSGIPEVKTILQGVHLEKHLTFRTLISKLIGLMLAIGGGFPIGKEGPFVHMGSIVAHLMRRSVESIKPAYSNESRNYELIAAGCAAGVAATFSAPVGGVLFSIEVTTAYFAVRDYWRGFFAAACSAATFSLLRLWINPFEETVAALFQTKFRHLSYYPEELFIFACIGAICGLAGAMFIFIHRRYVLFLRRNSFMKRLFQQHWIVYPLTISIFYSAITYPYGLGQYVTGQIVFARSLRDFFANCTWHVNPLHAEACNEFMVMRWKTYDSVFIELGIFIVSFYFLVIIANTLPIPAGIFMPAFVIGAAIGRFIGELIAFGYPNGLRNDKQLLILPGIYSVVGAVSFCGAVTHTVSVSVIAFELTGQLLHIFPVMIAVLLSNIVCSSLQPSFFNSIIKIKHLPYFPDIPKSTSWVHEIRVGQIMVKNVKFLTKQSTYYELQELLSTTQKLMAYPLVDNSLSMILLGSVSRENLLGLLNQIVGDEARHAEYLRRMKLRSEFHEIKENEEYKDETLANASIASVFPKISFAEVWKHPNTEDIQRSRTGSLELNTNKKPKLKTSISEYDMRKSKEGQKKRSLDQIEKIHSGHDFCETLGSVLEKITQTFRSRKKEESEDLNEEERQIWEKEQFSKEINYSYTIIDPAPFQLVEDTSLYKVHSIFSLLGIRRAYVTKCGVLVGVIAVKEIASAIERIQAGTLTAVTKRQEEDECNEKDNLPETSESDTDNEDIILPRVEFDKTTNSEILEAKFAALYTSIGREVSNKDRRKSCPYFSGKSHQNFGIPRYKRKSCDIILENLSSTDDQPVKQNFSRVVEKFRKFRDSISESQKRTIPNIVEKALSKISSNESSDSDSRASDHFIISSDSTTKHSKMPSSSNVPIETSVSQETQNSSTSLAESDTICDLYVKDDEKQSQRITLPDKSFNEEIDDDDDNIKEFLSCQDQFVKIVHEIYSKKYIGFESNDDIG
ncbi:Chloride channel protein [Dirofilaria immitis]